LLFDQGISLSDPKVVEDFISSPLILNLLTNLANRIGEEKISFKILKTISKGCAHEYSIEGYSPWCFLLTDNEWQIMQFVSDLETYFTEGYGREINEKKSCPLVNHLIHMLENFVHNNSFPKTYLYFTHAGALFPFYSSLGLFAHFDRAFENYWQNNCNTFGNEWRSNLIMPFSSNFALVLYKCSQSHDISSYKVLTLLQETPVTVKGCSSPFCPLQQFLNTYSLKESNCDLNQICRI